MFRIHRRNIEWDRRLVRGILVRSIKQISERMKRHSLQSRLSPWVHRSVPFVSITYLRLSLFSLLTCLFSTLLSMILEHPKMHRDPRLREPKEGISEMDSDGVLRMWSPK